MEAYLENNSTSWSIFSFSFFFSVSPRLLKTKYPTLPTARALASPYNNPLDEDEELDGELAIGGVLPEEAEEDDEEEDDDEEVEKKDVRGVVMG
jgi:hypothetical protein